MDTEKMKQQLMDRIRQNNADYHDSLLSWDRQDLIDNALKIYRHDQAHWLISNCLLEESEIRYLLQFQDPLEVVSDLWTNSYFDLAGMDEFDNVVMDYLQKVGLDKEYPLITDAKPPEPLHKFVNVDVIASMQSIMGQITSFYQSDFEYDKKHILSAARSEEPEKRNLLWLCRTSGTHLHEERDVFIKGTGSFNHVQFYHHDCQSEQVGLYSIEITGMKNGVVRGNIYERDRHQYAELAARGASLYTDDTLTFSSGKVVQIPHSELTGSKQSSLEYDYGKIMGMRHEAEDESMVRGALIREHERREKLPKGRIDTLLKKLNNQRVQLEADRIVSEIQRLKEPNSPQKNHFMVEVSVYFRQLASTRDMDMLVDKMAAHFPGQTFYFSVPDGRKEPHFFIKPEAARQSAAEHKPSIKEQLAAPPVPGDKPPTKSNDREVR